LKNLIFVSSIGETEGFSEKKGEDLRKIKDGKYEVILDPIKKTVLIKFEGKEIAESEELEGEEYLPFAFCQGKGDVLALSF